MRGEIDRVDGRRGWEAGEWMGGGGTDGRQRRGREAEAWMGDGKAARLTEERMGGKRPGHPPRRIVRGEERRQERQGRSLPYSQHHGGHHQSLCHGGHHPTIALCHGGQHHGGHHQSLCPTTALTDVSPASPPTERQPQGCFTPALTNVRQPSPWP